MRGLKCTTDNCEFREGCHCTAGIVNITKSGRCASKIKRDGGVLEQEFSNMEAAEEFDYSKNMDLLIDCESTNCYYNKHNRCTSPIVNVEDKLVNTKCVTRCKTRDQHADFQFN